MKGWIERLLLVGCSTLIAVLMSEGIVRILRVERMCISSGTIQSNDADAGWVGYPGVDVRFRRPGSFDVRVLSNSKGLRDTEKDYAKPAGTRRLVILGDSFMWGYGVENEEMFSAILQEQLPGSESVNLGVKGYSTVQELVRFETEGIQYEPDVTVLVFCWNDLEDNFDDKSGARPVAAVEADDELKIENRPIRRPFKAPVKQWFSHHSRLFGLLDYSSELFKVKLKERRRAKAVAAESEASSVPQISGNAKKGIMEFSTADIYSHPGPELDLAWEAMRLLLKRMKALASKGEGRLVVVYATPIEAVDREIFAHQIRNAGLDPRTGDVDWDRPSDRLGEVCASLDVSYVNLSPAFRRHPDPISLFLKGDPHWSAAGHRLAAETVADYIQASTELTAPGAQALHVSNLLR